VETSRLADCVRCGKTLQPAHRFCPECGLPASGGSVLSSQIGVLRESVQSARGGRTHTPWRRLLVPTASAVTVALVMAVGLLLFNRPLIEIFFPEVREAEAAPIVMSPSWEPEWVSIPRGDFHVGAPFEVSDEELEARLGVDVDSEVKRWFITNTRWLEFLLANEQPLKKEGLWREGRESMVPKYATGWRRAGGDRNGTPLPPDGRDGFDRPDDLVHIDEIDHIRTYLKWHFTTPGYHIHDLHITNEVWLDFLQEEQATLRAEGIFERCVPGPGSGWQRDRDSGLPLCPIEFIERDAEEMAVSDLGDDALALFHAWRRTSDHALWPPGIEGVTPIPNWLWMTFLDENEESLIETGMWTEAVPGPDSGWSFQPNFRAVMPTYLQSVPDRRAITGVGVDALERYHDWSSLKRIGYDFEISRTEVTNALWRDFIEDQRAELARDGLLDEAVPGHLGGWELDASGRYAPPADALDLPVRNVSALAASRFGDYLEKRLDQPGIQIRVPTAREWEYAARADSWRSYPWGPKFMLPSEPATGDPKPPYGIYDRRPLPVDAVDPDDVSLFGVLGMGTNVRELVEHWEWWNGEEYLNRTELRGASFKALIPNARVKAKVWIFREVDRRNQWPHVGVRLVKVDHGDPD